MIDIKFRKNKLWLYWTLFRKLISPVIIFRFALLYPIKIIPLMMVMIALFSILINAVISVNPPNEITHCFDESNFKFDYALSNIDHAIDPLVISNKVCLVKEKNTSTWIQALSDYIMIFDKADRRWFAFTVSLSLIFLFSYFLAFSSLMFLRGSPTEYARTLLEILKTDKLVQMAVIESLYILKTTATVDNSEKLRARLKNLNIKFDIQNQLVNALEKKFKISRLSIINGFTGFSGSIFTNRMRNKLQNKKHLDDYKFNIDRGHVLTEIETDNIDSLELQNELIEKHSLKQRQHLDAMYTTKLELGALEDVFNVRSASAAVQAFLNFLSHQIDNISSLNDIKLILSLQKSYWNGMIWEHLLATTLIAVCDSETTECDFNIYKSRIAFLLLHTADTDIKQQQLMSSAGFSDVREFCKYVIDNWFIDNNKIVHYERMHLKSVLDTYIPKTNNNKIPSLSIIFPIQDLPERNKPSAPPSHGQEKVFDYEMDTLIITCDHSRTIRHLLIEHIIREYHTKLDIFVLETKDSNIAFGSKLLAHQIVNEYIFPETNDFIGKGKAGQHFKNVKFGNKSQLKATSHAYNKIVYLFSAEEWRKSNGKPETYLKFSADDVMIKSDKQTHVIIVTLSHKQNVSELIEEKSKVIDAKLKIFKPQLSIIEQEFKNEPQTLYLYGERTE